MRIGSVMMLAAFGVAVSLSSAHAQSPPAVRADWAPIEEVKTYPITGTSGIELYSSIGEHGPEVGRHVRAIAHTNFKLTWTRRYDPQPDGACVLSVAKPKLIITYTLPRPARRFRRNSTPSGSPLSPASGTMRNSMARRSLPWSRPSRPIASG